MYKFILISLLTSLSILAQERKPHIGYVFPAGGQVGKTFEVIVGGMNIFNAKNISFTKPGIKLKEVRKLDMFGRLRNDVRRELMPIFRAIKEGRDPIKASHAFQTKRFDQKNKNESDFSKDKGKFYLNHSKMFPEEAVEIIKKLSPMQMYSLSGTILERRNALQASPAIAQSAILLIEIDPETEPGGCEMRIENNLGFSNSLQFRVDNLPEKIDYQTTELKCPSVMNGQIMPGEVDKFSFKAKKGERITFELAARELIPFLSDAVPGWFQPMLFIKDSAGKELKFADDFYFSPDPKLQFKAPKTGEYTVEIRDSIYRGRKDFVYRLTTSRRPLPKRKVEPIKLDYPLKEMKLTGQNCDWSNAVMLKKEVIVKNNLLKAGDRHCYKFTAKKGEEFACEIFARRINSLVDSSLQIFDSQQKLLASNDDHDWGNIGTETQLTDSYLIFTAPADGTYYLKAFDNQLFGGEGYSYQLRLDQPRPHFKVFMQPSVVNMRRGQNSSAKLHIFRYDGFNDDISLSLGGLPKGINIMYPQITKESKEIPLQLKMSGFVNAGEYPFSLTVKEKNGTSSQKVIPCDQIMQAFLYLHLVPAEEGIIKVIGGKRKPSKKGKGKKSKKKK